MATQAMREFTDKAAALTKRYEQLAKDSWKLLAERPKNEDVDAATAVLVSIGALYGIIGAPRTIPGPSHDYLQQWTERLYGWAETISSGAFDERQLAAREG